MSKIPLLRRFIEKEEKWARFFGSEGRKIGDLYNKTVQRLKRGKSLESKEALEVIMGNTKKVSEGYEDLLKEMEKCDLIKRKTVVVPYYSSVFITDYLNQPFYETEIVETEIVAPTEFGKELTEYLEGREIIEKL